MARGYFYTEAEDRRLKEVVRAGARSLSDFDPLGLELGRGAKFLRERAIRLGLITRGARTGPQPAAPRPPAPKKKPGPPPAVAYSDEGDAQLLALKAQGLTETAIAAQTGRSRMSVRRRLVWLNGREAMRAASRPPVRATDHVPAGQAKACERHARACLAAGGFWALSERRVGQGKLVACLPLIPPPGLLEGAQ